MAAEETSGNSSLHIKEAIVIKPAESTPTRLLPLSPLDSQLFLRFTIEYLLVFNARPALDQAVLASRIKSALARILVPYYPLAGRVRAKPDGSSLEVVCRGQGAVFVQASDSNLTINDFDKAPKSVTQWRKLLSFHVADVLQGAPLVVIQLTWLKDGAATLGVGFNHCVTDGIGSAEFLNSLSELVTSHGRVKVLPVWDRHLLDSVKPSVLPTHHFHPEFNRVPDVSGFLSRFSDETLSPTSVVFDKTRQNELKRVANSTESEHTCFEVVSAHVWRSWARALNLPSNQILKLLFSINIRNRVKPSLPSGYYGNAFVLGCATASFKDLTTKGLGYAAMLIKRAKERVDNGHVRSVIDSVSGARTSPDSVGVLIVSQWSRLGLERVDFGMGRAVHVGPICSDRYCLILPVHNLTDAVKVMVAVPVSGVDKYEYLVNNPHS
ncbi:alcohol acyltransferase 9 [Euphorbia lathyris]|uniref:alcohol acyltransferase 9 n=1 Tax=Euphorbia lathyris TaxID=212925 RepID=UPI0033134FCE